MPVHLEARTTGTKVRNETVGAAISRNNVFGSKRHSCLGHNDNEIDQKAHVGELENIMDYFATYWFYVSYEKGKP